MVVVLLWIAYKIGGGGGDADGVLWFWCYTERPEDNGFAWRLVLNILGFRIAYYLGFRMVCLELF